MLVLLFFDSYKVGPFNFTCFFSSLDVLKNPSPLTLISNNRSKMQQKLLGCLVSLLRNLKKKDIVISWCWEIYCRYNFISDMASGTYYHIKSTKTHQFPRSVCNNAIIAF